jgi:hypothetical protein
MTAFSPVTNEARVDRGGNDDTKYSQLFHDGYSFKFILCYQNNKLSQQAIDASQTAPQSATIARTGWLF